MVFSTLKIRREDYTHGDRRWSMNVVKMVVLICCVGGTVIAAVPGEKGRADARKTRVLRHVRPARKTAGIFGTNIQLTPEQEKHVNKLFEQYRIQLNAFANRCGNFPSVFMNQTPGEWDNCMDESFAQLKIALQKIRDFVLDAWKQQQRGMSPALLERALLEKSAVIDAAIRKMLRQQRADWRHLTYSARNRPMARPWHDEVQVPYSKKPAGHLL
jgi:hypothetical protein